MIFYNDIWNALYVKGFNLFFFLWGIRGTPHAHQLKNSELPQNEKMRFLLQVSTKFCSGVL
ncbi:hypothetical protein COK28_22800 [Bacillus cereus]|nr:hypothetical protein COK28_22800 [Bacillus cereus]PGP37535.1 hypothetical protein CN989_09030 [Bacillus cereus]PGS14857.1 hypothetical protein COC45_08805 [Bacillus cereus]